VEQKKKVQLLYIMSPSYSGSTLLTSLIAENPTISTVGELKASALGDVSEYSCSCGTKITECEFWLNLTEYMQSLNKTFSLDDFGTHFRSANKLTDILLRAVVRGGVIEGVRKFLLKNLTFARDRLEGVLQQNKDIIDYITAQEQTKVFLDGSKDPNRLLHLMRSGYWDIKIIYLTRDGRGVCNSYMKHVGVPMDVAAHEWLVKCEEMNNVLRYFDDSNVLKIKYEGLCEDAKGTLRSIYSFINVEFDRWNPEVINSNKHLLGNNMRLVSINEIKLDEKWRDLLSENDLSIFYKNCSKMQKQLGYCNAESDCC
jgi:hypothetical protein